MRSQARLCGQLEPRGCSGRRLMGPQTNSNTARARCSALVGYVSARERCDERAQDRGHVGAYTPGRGDHQPALGGRPQPGHRAAATALTATTRHAWGPYWSSEVNADDWGIWVNDAGGLAAQQTAKPSAEDVQV